MRWGKRKRKDVNENSGRSPPPPPNLPLSPPLLRTSFFLPPTNKPHKLARGGGRGKGSSCEQFGHDLDHLIDIDKLHPALERRLLVVPDERALDRAPEKGRDTLVRLFDEVRTARNPDLDLEDPEFPACNAHTHIYIYSVCVWRRWKNKKERLG